MEQTITRFINKHHLLEQNKKVLIGVSGGPDSMALLHFLIKLRNIWNLELTVLTIDHQLRGEQSVHDIDYVENICLKWNVDCVRTSLDVNAYKKTYQVSTQVAAREVRYSFFEEQMNKHNGDYLALGHHGDDQVETLMMRFVRSATSNALTGIPVKRSFATGIIIRPLLCVTKIDILEYCQVHNIIPRIDQSNEDATYTRNYYRKYLIPIIKEKNNNIHTTMQHLSESLDADNTFLKNEAVKMAREVINYNSKKKQASFEIDVFKSYSLSLQRRCYHLVLEYLYNHLPDSITYVHEDIFFHLLEDKHGNAQVDFPNDLKVERSYNDIFFFFDVQIDEEIKFGEVIRIPGETKLPDGAKIKAFYTELVHDEGKHSLVCDINKLSLPLHIRTRQPGDRMSFKGLSGSKKIKDIFIDLKIPIRDRDKWPIITDNNGEILWLVGLRKSIQNIDAKDSIHIQLEYIKT